MKWFNFLLFFIFGLTLTNLSFSSLEPFKKKIGGRIAFLIYCPLPVPHISYTTIQPVQPNIGQGSWAWIPGASINYLYGPPSHPGQPILGLATESFMDCLDISDGHLISIGPASQGTELYHGTGK